jgi:hypothetical protein
MLFSDAFGVTRGRADDWFDPIVDSDTKIFVDPFLIFQEPSEEWRGAHEQLIGHFDKCFHLIAEGNRNPSSTAYKKALALLTFPEPREFCLGYTESGTHGAGGGPGYARLIAAAMESAIVRGLSDLRHFEELGILNEGIGPDRISDVTCNVLRARFIAYTKVVAQRHGIETVRFRVPGAAYDPVRVAWRTEHHDLPCNPVSGRPVLLVPERFLRELPVLNADDWWENYEAQQLRTDVNYEVMQRVNKKAIVATARAHPEAVRTWVTEREGQAARSYNLAKDPRGVYQWDPATRAYVDAHPLTISPPPDDEAFFNVIELVIAEFKRFVEEQSGWRLLWNDDGTEKPEEAAQLVFMGVARSYCKANNIVVDREVELGRGPVDFKFSNGYSRRAHLEAKKLHSGKFWSGLEQQLPSYLLSDDCNDGWYLAVRYRIRGTSADWNRKLDDIIRTAAESTGKKLRLRRVDVTPKVSASKIPRTNRRGEESAGPADED